MELNSRYRICTNVTVGPDYDIQDYVIIGVPPRNKQEGELATLIGRKSLIRSGTVIYAGNKIGNNFTTGHNALIREMNTIGDNVSIGSNSVVEGYAFIADNVRIHSLVFICEHTRLEEGSWIGPNVVFTNVPHPLCSKAKECMKGAVVEQNAKIGANSTILPGINIGKNALIGAGSVVIKDVPPDSVVAGNPARIIKSIEELECPHSLIEHPY